MKIYVFGKICFILNKNYINYLLKKENKLKI